MTIFYSAHEPGSGKFREAGSWDPSDPYDVGITAPADQAAVDAPRARRRSVTKNTSQHELQTADGLHAGKHVALQHSPAWKRALKFLSIVIGLGIAALLFFVLFSLGGV